MWNFFKRQCYISYRILRFFSLNDWADAGNKKEDLVNLCNCGWGVDGDDLAKFPSDASITNLMWKGVTAPDDTTCTDYNYEYESCGLPCMVAKAVAAVADAGGDVLCDLMPNSCFCDGDCFSGLGWILWVIVGIIALVIVGYLYKTFGKSGSPKINIELPNSLTNTA